MPSAVMNESQGVVQGLIIWKDAQQQSIADWVKTHADIVRNPGLDVDP